MKSTVISNEKIEKAKIDIDGELIEIVDELSFDISYGDRKYYVSAYLIDSDSDNYSIRVYDKSVEGHTDEICNAYMDSCGGSCGEIISTGFKAVDNAILDYLYSPQIGHIIAF